MQRRLISCFALSLVGGISIFAGCNYEAPQAGGTSSTGAAGQGGSGEGGMGQGGMGQGGMGGASSTSSSGQGGSAGQTQGNCLEPMPTCSGYTGPNGTEGVGICRASRSTCMLDDMWSACDQGFVPMYEHCATIEDTNCDGHAPCTGAAYGAYGAVGMQSPGDDVILSVAVGDGNNGQDGAQYAVGARSAAINLPNGFRVLAWRRTSGGQLQEWSSYFEFTQSGPANGAIATGVVVLPTSGEVVITGFFYGGQLLINDTYQEGSTDRASFVVRAHPTNGIQHAFFISGGDIEAKGIAADTADNIYIIGNYTGTPQIGSATLPASDGEDGFIASFTSNGAYRWHQVFTGTGTQSVDAIAWINDTGLVTATRIENQTNVNTTGGIKPFDGGPQPDILVSRLQTATGLAVWNRRIESNTEIGAKVEVGGLAATSTTIALGGRFTRRVTIGSTSYTNMDINVADSFIATMKTSDGNFISHQASQVVGTAQEVRAVAFDLLGDIVMTGGYETSYPLPGTATLNSSNGYDAFIIKLDPTLRTRWVKSLGNAAMQSGHAVAIGKTTGRVFVGGRFQQQLVGIEPLMNSIGGTDAFLVELTD
jgi:hypothetical protein